MELRNGRFYGNARGTRSSQVATLAETSYAPGARVPTHTHEYPFFCLVVEGRLDEQFDGTVEPIPEGGVLFHPAQAPHAEDFPWARSRAFNIQPDGAWLNRLDDLNLRLPTEQRVAGPASRLTWLAWQVRSEWGRGDDVMPLAVEGLLLGMLAETLRMPARTSESARPAWLLAVRDALHASVRSSPTILELAIEVGVDPAHLARTFRRYFGCPPGEYLRGLRVDRARRALETTDNSLCQVGLEAGFTDQSHFTRVFRRYVGTTPGAYRKVFRAVPDSTHSEATT